MHTGAMCHQRTVARSRQTWRVMREVEAVEVWDCNGQRCVDVRTRTGIYAEGFLYLQGRIVGPRVCAGSCMCIKCVYTCWVTYAAVPTVQLPWVPAQSVMPAVVHFGKQPADTTA